MTIFSHNVLSLKKSKLNMIIFYTKNYGSQVKKDRIIGFKYYCNGKEEIMTDQTEI